MNEGTINAEVTMGGAVGVLLVNRYRVVKQLGQGGMGSVWLAEDTKLDGRKVAVKMLPSILVSNKRAYAQVKQEALVSLKLTHPNIVAVRAFEEEGGNPFLVMDYIEGQTLDDYLAEKGKLSEEETIRLLKPIAAALDYAHGQGVVHRDVKPGNVMIDKSGHPYVLDFGIAREVQETMTRVTGKLSSGTLMYMSPEQLHGAAPKPAQDVYSFAAMAYECLSGHPPFSRGQIEYQIEHDMPAPLSGNIAICPSVMAGLAKTPEARPATCVAVLSTGAKARGADDGASAGRMRIGLVAAGLLVLAGVVAAAWLSGRTPAAAPKAAMLQPITQVENPLTVAPAVVTQVVEKVVENPAAPVAPVANEDADRRRQEEVAKLTTTRTKISIKVAAAKGDYEKVAPYRSERDGFEAHLAEIDRQWETVEGVQNPKTLAEAEETLVAVSEVADAIAFELNWLATNRDGRDAAKRIEKEIADELEAQLRTFKADDVAKSKYDKGQGERKSAAQALSRGEFASARRQYETAKTTLAAALAEARRFHVKTALAVATEYKNAAQWQKCVDETKKVLGWDPENVEATALNAEAEQYLMPSAKVIAKIGEREVDGAILHIGQLTSRLPGVWNAQSLRNGHFFPEDKDYEITYEERGKSYVGFMRGGKRDVDWQGQKTFVVTLVEYNGPARPGDTKTIELPGGASMTFCWCPATTSSDWKKISNGDDFFWMGSPEDELGRSSWEDEKRHRVKLTTGFWIAQTPVTQQQYEAVTGKNPTKGSRGRDKPVTNVSWPDCREFCRQLSARIGDWVKFELPTEAQWEYACRAGTTTALNNGRNLTTRDGVCAHLDEVAWYVKNSGGEAHSVKGKRKNDWNLYDMHGNVFEWCLDVFDNYGEGLQVDFCGDTSGTCWVYRGGSFNINEAACCRSAARLCNSGGCSFDSKTLGFRPVMIINSLEQPE